MEPLDLQATGFFGSFGLITFDGGRLSDLNVMTCILRDGQLMARLSPCTNKKII